MNIKRVLHLLRGKVSPHASKMKITRQIGDCVSKSKKIILQMNYYFKCRNDIFIDHMLIINLFPIFGTLDS